MNGEYAPGEPKQEITLTIRFNTKHNPGSESHLKTMMQTGSLYIEGSKVYEEGGKLYYNI